MKMQDYYHDEMIQYAHTGFTFPFNKITFSYTPLPRQKGAALNFHLTRNEKLDIRRSLRSVYNIEAFKKISFWQTDDPAAGSAGKRPEQPRY
ncbi:MAG TPA: hypothetical protein PLL71_04540, partial [Agriterribacter sp.]|nr:hypothetical protein [Agriterribacter sp.]